MQSIYLVFLCLAVSVSANRNGNGHPAVLRRRPAPVAPVAPAAAPAAPPANGNGMVANFINMFKQAPPAVQQQIVAMFNQAMAPPAPAAAPVAPAAPAAPVAPAAPPRYVEDNGKRLVTSAPLPAAPPAPVAPAVAPAAPAAPVMPPTRTKSAPRPVYTYNGRPALFNPAELNGPPPAVPAPVVPAANNGPVIDPIQFMKFFTDAPEVKKNGEYIEY